MDNKNWIASRDALSKEERVDWIMGEKIRLICEGDLDCTNQVYLTKEEVYMFNKEAKIITCEDCRPKYKDDIRKNPLDMGVFEN